MAMRNKTKHSLYRTYWGMRNRCYNRNSASYKNYGGRGIIVCERWLHSFDAFVEDMGPRPFNMTIERINTNGNYEPSNCKWATLTENARNKRSKRLVTIDGKTMHVAALSELHGIDMRTIYYRIKQGWPTEKILSREAQYNNHESQKKAVAVHAALKRAQKRCKRGHKLSGKNLYIAPSGSRCCRACKRAIDRFIYHGKKGRIDDYL